MYREKVTVEVPATAANLGPGFDCIGMALDFENTLTLERAETSAIIVHGEGAGLLSLGEDNLIFQAISAFFQKRDKPRPSLRVRCHNRIPLARGLGSSAAAVVGGLMAANYLTGEPLGREELLPLALSLEGHPDNVAPALFGGCQVVVEDGGKLYSLPLPIPPNLKAVLFIPATPLSTKEARRILPPQVKRAEAVYNIGRGIILGAALASGRLEFLRLASQDRLHQPQRASLFPPMEGLFQAALDAGALGACLSGAGPTILAWVEGGEEKVASAFLEGADKIGLAGEVKIARPSLKGAREVVS